LRPRKRVSFQVSSRKHNPERAATCERPAASSKDKQLMNGCHIHQYYPNDTFCTGASSQPWHVRPIVDPLRNRLFSERKYGGHPHSEHLRVTEKFRRADFGHMHVQVTFDDPETLTKPLTISVAVNYAVDTDMLEYVCNEGERDTDHLVGTANAAKHPSAAVLNQYAGEYEFRDGVVASRNFFGPHQIVAVVDGQLFMKDFPLVPQTETRFDSTAGTIEFFLDSSGRVTHLILSAAEGDAKYDRKR